MVNTDLVQKAKFGDNTAFNILVEKYYSKILFFTIKRVKNSDTAQDIVQNTFLKAFTNIRTLRSDNAFQYWLFSICKNEINRYYRKSNNYISLEDIELPSKIEVSDIDYSNMLLMSISKLSAEMADVVLYKYFCDMKIKDIAALLHISEKLVKSRLYEGRKKLRKYIPKASLDDTILSSQLQKERLMIMEQVKMYVNGAYVFSRLALYDQCSFYKAIANDKPLTSEVLSSIGKISGGKEFIKSCSGSITTYELTKILLYCDKEVRTRVFNEIEDSSIIKREIDKLSGIEYDLETVEVWLNVHSVEDTIDWYEKVFYWRGEIDEYAKNDKGIATFGCITNGNYQVDNEIIPSTTAMCIMRGEVEEKHSHVIFVIVSDIELIYNNAKHYNCDIVNDIKTQPWGMKTFELKDINGYILRVAQRV